MFSKFKFPDSIRDLILVGIFVFLWNVNSRLASIETTQQIILSGKLTIAQTK